MLISPFYTADAIQTETLTVSVNMSQINKTGTGSAIPSICYIFALSPAPVIGSLDVRVGVGVHWARSCHMTVYI